MREALHGDGSMRAVPQLRPRIRRTRPRRRPRRIDEIERCELTVSRRVSPFIRCDRDTPLHRRASAQANAATRFPYHRRRRDPRRERGAHGRPIR